MLPVAVIPMHTPEEAIAELDHAVGELGFRAVTLAGYVKRDWANGNVPKNGEGPAWLDLIGIDSVYDYDPVWRRCAELGVAPTFHSGSQTLGFRQSNSNYIFNHLGNFAAGAEAICKALFLGGVPRRFPELRFGFMEGGVGWATQLYISLVSYWEKRNVDAIQHYNPAASPMSSSTSGRRPRSRRRRTSRRCSLSRSTSVVRPTTRWFLSRSTPGWSHSDRR
jgi:predicted TIM-barrel fold metal-dependent hydrolase